MANYPTTSLTNIYTIATRRSLIFLHKIASLRNKSMQINSAKVINADDLVGDLKILMQKGQEKLISNLGFLSRESAGFLNKNNNLLSIFIPLYPIALLSL